MLKSYVFAKTRLMDLKDHLANLRRDESGAAMIEYALLVGLVAIAGITALTALSGKMATAFNNIGTSISNHTAVK
ncbi:MAG: Flp/Fap pilin component [Phenylobacterium sp.]|nr:Flp/Fap pilin component [Phenylobacterium sp.]